MGGIFIESAENGFIAKWTEESDDGHWLKRRAVFEFDTNHVDHERECMTRVLAHVRDHFGIHNSKHNKHNLNIEVVENTFE